MKQRARNIDPPRLWQWPNILGVDAAIIAVSWFWLYSPGTAPFPLATATVLALSVWLTYLADRLLDIRESTPMQPISHRHRFTYRNKQKLWRIWWFFLLLNVILAFCLLNQTQLLRGGTLLLLTLSYTLAVQHLKLRYLPKESSVGFIFTAGVIIFLDTPPAWPVLLTLFFMFTGNCTLIAEKEKEEAFRNKSKGAPQGTNFSPYLLGAGLCISTITSPLMLTSLVPLSILYLIRSRFTNENYRILVDAMLLCTPLIVLIGRLFF